MIKTDCHLRKDGLCSCMCSMDGDRKQLFAEFHGTIMGMIRGLRNGDENDTDSAITRGIICDILESIQDDI